MPAMIFIQNKYTSTYYSIIANAQLRDLPSNTYTEKHHIIPKSLGGNNSKYNLVRLTAREHFICHRLLVKMTVGLHKSKMISALWYMSNISKYKVTSQEYAQIKSQFSKSRSIQYLGKGNPRYGVLVADKTIQKIKQARAQQDVSYLKDRIITPEWRAKIQKTLLNGSSTKGKPKPAEFSQKLKKPKNKSACPHCRMIIAPHIMKRFHGDNCKVR
jgi:hypothetical protein